MSELLDQLDAAPEVIAQDQVQQADVSDQAEAAAPVEKPSAPIPSREEVQEKNWTAARGQLAEQQRMIKQLQYELDSVRRAAPPAPKEPEEDLELLTESEKKLYNKIKTLEQRVQTNQAKEADYVVDRLRSKYADFDDVVNAENITYLQTNNAALAKALASLKDDPYEQGLAAYDVLRKTEWFQQRETMQDKVKLQENAKKPMSVQAVRKQGALSEANTFANGLTPELKKTLLKEMAESRKRA